MKLKHLLVAVASLALGALTLNAIVPSDAHAGVKKNFTDNASKTFGQEIDTTDGMQKLPVFDVPLNAQYVFYVSGSGTVQGSINTTHTAKVLMGLSGISPTAATDADAYRFPLKVRFSNLETTAASTFSAQARTFTAIADSTAPGIVIQGMETREFDLPIFPTPFTFQWKVNGTGTTVFNGRIEVLGRK